MQVVAQSWLVLQLTGSGTLLGLVAAAQFLPVLLLGPYGGLVADRAGKRRLLMGTQSVLGVLAWWHWPGSGARRCTRRRPLGVSRGSCARACGMSAACRACWCRC